MPTPLTGDFFRATPHYGVQHPSVTTKTAHADYCRTQMRAHPAGDDSWTPAGSRLPLDQALSRTRALEASIASPAAGLDSSSFTTSARQFITTNPLVTLAAATTAGSVVKGALGTLGAVK